ncbi:MAG: IS1634 family transposase [Erysipelotrichaceae bacterium]
MFIRKTKRKHADGSIWTQVQLVEGFRPGKGLPPKQRVIKGFGYLENQEDPIKFISELEQYVKKQNSQKNPESVPLPDTSRSLNDPLNRDLNYGFFILEGIYNQLDFVDFFKKHRTSKATYDLEAIFKYLFLMQVIFPDSKRSEYMDIHHIYLSDKVFNIHHIYRALDEIDDLKDEIEKHINVKLSTLMHRDIRHVYLDITNFYQERDYAIPDTLGQKGVSKEHRTEPIIQFGLLLDGNGMPFMSETFAGNTNDSLTLKPMLKKVREKKMVEGKIICVADKGLNSKENIDYLCNHGDGYLFSQIVKGKKGKRYHEKMFNEDGYIINKDSSYKYKQFIEDYEGKDEEGHKIIRKRNVLIYWSKKEAELQKSKRDYKVSRAEKSLKNNAYTIDHTKEKYIKFTDVIKETGEVTDIYKLSEIDQEKIKEEERFDGYFCLVSSELDFNENKFREIYHNLWKIENSFRIMKTDEGTRPIYLGLDEHIKAHLLICQLALLMFRLIQASMKEEMISAERIQRVLQNCVLNTWNVGWLHIHEVSQKTAFIKYIDKYGHSAYRTKESGEDEVREDFNKLCGSLGIEIKSAYMKQEIFNKEIKKAAVTLQ